MPSVIDLFAGAGGLSLGAARAGFEVVAAVENDKHAMESHIENFPLTNHIFMDIRNLTGFDILHKVNREAAEISGVIGGPPCQGFSFIGAGDANDIRNQLFVKFFEIVRDIRPVFFVAENVPGIMQTKYNAIREAAFNMVDEYIVLDPIFVKACEYGAPTTRTRVFFIGFRNVPAAIDPFTQDHILAQRVNNEERTNVSTALEGLRDDIKFRNNHTGCIHLDRDYINPQVQHRQSNFFYHRIIGMRPNGIGNPSYIQRFDRYGIVNGENPTKHSLEVKRRYKLLKYGQRDCLSRSSKLDPNGFCPTLRAGTGPEKGSYQAVRPIHFSKPRVITPREAARLQGFPDWYMLPSTIWHSFRQIGNSVSPIVAERILQAIIQRLVF